MMMSSANVCGGQVLRATLMTMVTLCCLALLLGLTGCGEEAEPGAGEVSATYLVDGQPVEVSFDVTLERESGMWVLSGWSETERLGIVLQWSAASVTAPGTWSNLAASGAVQVAMVHPRLDHPTNVHITATQGGEVTFDSVGGAKESVSGWLRDVTCQHTQDEVRRSIVLQEGSFAGLLP